MIEWLEDNRDEVHRSHYWSDSRDWFDSTDRRRDGDPDFGIYAVLPGAVNTKLNSDLDLEREPSELLAPKYVARKFLDLQRVKRSPVSR